MVNILRACGYIGLIRAVYPTHQHNHKRLGKVYDPGKFSPTRPHTQGMFDFDFVD